YPDEVRGEIDEVSVPTPTTGVLTDSFLYADADAAPGSARLMMQRTGTVAMATAPITVDAEFVGCVIVGVTDGAPRLRDDTTLPERLRGLAAQAASAVRNARLLDQIRHQALHDTLTGLPNRALVLDRVDNMLARARRRDEPASLLFLDLDGFKGVNDSLGHETGDRLLQAVAARLMLAVRDGDTVGRLGGDEFVVLVEAASDGDDAETVASRILTDLREPFELTDSHHPLVVTTSIGIACGDRLNASELLRDADVALYRAKEAGRDRAVSFAPEMHTAIRDQARLHADLRRALERDEFFLVYQPIFDLRSRTVTGAEALLRWRHPERGVVQPVGFIPTLEDTGLIVDVGRWVIFEACRQAAVLRSHGHDLVISVNVSARQLESDRVVSDLRAALALHDIDPHRLVIEITETTLMRDPDATARRLAAIRDLGTRVAIDDFGTGYSSLAYIRQFPLDVLKIDRSFVSAMAGSDQADALVRALVQLGKSLGLETLAEGIEEVDQFDALQRQECDSGQGFLLARPLEPEALESFLMANVTTPVG
ncbi:MAG: EAL domain-containing protein, partial [Acidimicrobiia bacterium]